MRWLIYYADGTTYAGAQQQAPERGVQAIIQQDETTGWYAITGYDYYVWLWDGLQWAGVDVFGLWDYLAQPGWKRVLFGRAVSNEEYETIYARALKDMGAKSALRVGERTLSGAPRGVKP